MINEDEHTGTPGLTFIYVVEECIKLAEPAVRMELVTISRHLGDGGYHVYVRLHWLHIIL